ncbi:ce9f9be7-abfb-43ec-ab92-24aa73e21e9a-CDS [Sclerotinia trifoliorum]|uniref:Ce9f9be7-abfb-43ec-ab92-24aa73e21e9a-CDS n=1 Tax=Sclerotinia trifoliorum TaxID=28548 RepID=A0A8H2W289_9HELO|nr:ce9f9be7-abfb-43ec-ab92-24aa73e21e9a-CDS [Sclerotinia trifoliorum]
MWAPKEYQTLVNALLRKHKDGTEPASPHINARKLAALFEGICPPTSNLIKAYGVRVLEIAGLAQEQTSQPSNSMFAVHNGVDGTLIWAAAISAFTALHVQFWTALQAISIWLELVK